jgi:hypothetical protein
VFQSVVLNSQFATSTINDDRRAVFWAKSSDASPLTLALGDLRRLWHARGEGKLFARKFDSRDGARIIDLVESEFLGKPTV